MKSRKQKKIELVEMMVEAQRLRKIRKELETFEGFIRSMLGAADAQLFGKRLFDLMKVREKLEDELLKRNPQLKRGFQGVFVNADDFTFDFERDNTGGIVSRRHNQAGRFDPNL